MRIAILPQNSSETAVGGLEAAVNLLARGLAEEGVEAKVFQPGRLPPDFFKLQNAPLLAKTVRYDAAGFDVVHTNGWNGYLNSLCKRPTLHTFHGTNCGLLRATSGLYNFTRNSMGRMFTLMEMASAASSSGLVSVAPHVKREVEKSYSKPSTVICNGVDGRFFRPSGRAKTQGIACCGALAAKGVLFAEELGKKAGTVVHVAGAPDRQFALAAGAREKFGMASHLAIRKVAYGKMPDFYNSSKLYAHLSYYEGMSLSTLEAMACGLPVVAWDLPFNSFLKGSKCAYLVRPFDIDALAETAGRMLGDPYLREKMGRCARAKVLGEFSQKRMAKSYIRAYGKLC